MVSKMSRKIYLVLIAAVMTVAVSWADTVQVTGTVVDDIGEPVIGASVLVKGTTNGCSTDIDGNFVLNTSSDATLVVSYVGMKRQEVSVDGQTKLRIVMNSTDITLDDVVVIGYGTMKKSDLTGAVSTVAADQLKKTPAANLDQALQGRAAGVTVNSSSGQPGAAAEVRIRGIGTVNNSAPIYVVDGVILDDISFLSPNDIESTEILKDASATAIYGSRGANGVIIVTTKNGNTDGRMEISFDMYCGWQNRWHKLDVMGRDEFVDTYLKINAAASEKRYFQEHGFNEWLAMYKGVGYKDYQPVVMTERNPDGLDYSSIDTDWQDEVFKKNAFIQNYHLSVSGGSDRYGYAISAGWFGQEGTIIGSDFNRLTLRANTWFKVKDWLKVGENISFVTTQSRLAMNNSSSAGASILSAALAMAPWDPTRYPAGSYNRKGEDLSGQIAAGTNFANVTNPLSMVEMNHPNDKTERLVGDVYVEITPPFVKGLVFRSDISLDLINTRNRSFKEAYKYSDYDQSLYNFLSSSMGRQSQLIWENTLTYNKTFNDIHELTAMVGQTMEETNYYSIGGSGADILNPVETNWYLSQTTRDRAEASDSVWRTRRFSLLGRLHYSLLSRYLVTVNFRADASSMFPENLWGYFPSTALAWKASEEEFLRNVKWLDFLKVRAGWGQIGNDKINSDSFTLAMFNAGPTFVDYVLGANQALVNGATVLTWVNNGGKWEVTEQWDLGVDFGLFNGLLSGTVDFFLRDTKDMLLTVKGPAQIGNRYDGTNNVGTVRNKGIEITLDHRNKIGDVNYSIGGNVSFIKNKLTALNGGQPVYSHIDNVVVCDEGMPLYSFYGYVYEGIYTSQEEVDAAMWGYAENNNPYSVGDAKYADLNHDGIIDDNDRTQLGSAFPWLTYGINLGLEWKGIDVSLFFQGVYGNQIYNQVRYRLEGRGDQSVLGTQMRDVWTTETPDGTIPDPRHSVNFFASSRFLESGAYFRLKNAQIGYTLPKAWTDKIGFNRCRIYVQGSNIFTLTPYTGYDPEVGGGVDYGNYPQSRTFLVGANISF